MDFGLNYFAAIIHTKKLWRTLKEWGKSKKAQYGLFDQRAHYKISYYRCGGAARDAVLSFLNPLCNWYSNSFKCNIMWVLNTAHLHCALYVSGQPPTTHTQSLRPLQHEWDKSCMLMTAPALVHRYHPKNNNLFTGLLHVGDTQGDIQLHLVTPGYFCSNKKSEVKCQLLALCDKSLYSICSHISP